MFFFKMLFCLLILVFPWPLRRMLLNLVLGYRIAPTARIGLSLIIPDMLEMDEHASIGHFNMCKGQKLVKLEQHSGVGRLNWITAEPLGSNFFSDDLNRNPELILGEQAFITSRHILDCTDSIVIGRFSTIAGYCSQLLTHSIDIRENRQACYPIKVGDYCFIGTNSVLLPDCCLPSFSILGASSILNKQYEQEYMLYAGTPARPIKEIACDWKYFSRLQGFVE